MKSNMNTKRKIVLVVMGLTVWVQTIVYAQTGAWTTPASATASGYLSGFGPSNAKDDNTSTNWNGNSSSGWLTVDMGAVVWSAGDRRYGGTHVQSNRVTSVQVSLNETDWTTVVSSPSAWGCSSGCWAYDSWTLQQVRYVRFNMASAGNIKVYEVDVDVIADTPTPTSTSTNTPTPTLTLTPTPIPYLTSCAAIANALQTISACCAPTATCPPTDTPAPTATCPPTDTPAPPTLTPTPAPTATCPACPKESGCASCCLHARDAAFMAACLTTFEEVKCYEIMKLLGPP